MTTTQLLRRQGAAPTGLAAAPVAGGGTFAAGAQFWKVTAVIGGVEGAPSAEATATIALNGQGSLTWTCPPGCQAIRVYRGTVTNAENVLVATLAGAPAAYSDTGTAGSAATPPAVAAWTNVTKNGTAPLKSNIPAGTPPGLAREVYEAMCDWCAVGTATTAGTSQQAKIGDKLAAGSGFDLQEV